MQRVYLSKATFYFELHITMVQLGQLCVVLQKGNIKIDNHGYGVSS